MRPIDADALELTLIGLREEAMRRADFSDAATISQIKILVKNSPTVADVQEVRHGKWEIIPPSKQYTDGCYQKFRCSECDAVFDRYSLYCPSCWARMDG